MKPIKAKYTEIVLLLARYIPWVFPKWLRFMAKSYSRKEQESIRHLYEKEDRIKSASLFDGSFKWKAISVVVKVEHDDLDSIRRWLKSNASPGDYNPERDDSVFENKYDHGGGFRNLGWIHFHRETRLTSLLRMEVETEFCDSCYVSLSKYSYGINYLSLYFFLKESATGMVSNVDVSEVSRYDAFASVNPFSQQFRVIQHHNKRNLVEDLINENINKVCSDVVSMAKKVLRLWRITKDESKLTLIADIYRDTNEPYFVEVDECEDDRHVHVCPRSFKFLDEKISSDSSEHFITSNIVEKNDLDAVFIKSKNIEEFDQFDNFARNGLTLYDSHIFISMFIDVARQHVEISEYANSALLKNSNKVETNYDILFESTNRLESLRENILAIQKEIPHGCREPYSDSAKRIAKYRLKLADKLKASIDRRVYGLNSEMQVQNLRFNRAYSLLVGVLIIVQILLAVLTIDWGNLDERFNSSFLKREDFVLKQNSTETDEHSKVPQSTTNASEFVVKP
ncbi:TPA: hypothetical protein GRI80_19295 [Vibrio parahaemolyticus]|nr:MULTISPECIES: hypothetical protein [Vibrio]MDW2300786.1 hypothetical protein [Vibrio sp. 1167]AVF75483.1 hypothetical protein AL539_17645 [Vibrio alginolyticus]AWA87915.1 hypothetical protein BSG32_02115 [Vibrio parahaemolyticus]EAS75571.1 hypothetical protein V12G01_10446 [Vibrio alginolyticus 12G01]EGQ7919397.1 hypothetical protein [Vibrio parahaemolyticus]